MIQVVILPETYGTSTDGHQYTLPPNVVLLLVRDGTARLLDLDGYFHAVSATGAKMLQETLRCNPEAAAERVAAEYGADVSQVRADLSLFLVDLERRGLVRRSRGRWGRAGTMLASLLLTSSLRCVELGARFSEAKPLILLTLAYLSFRHFGWTRTVASWQRYFGEVASPQSSQESEGVARAIDSAVRATAARHVLNVGCKERSLTCWALTRSARLPTTLVLGVDLFPLASHCWCELDSLVLTDFEDRCERFTPVLRYG